MFSIPIYRKICNYVYTKVITTLLVMAQSFASGTRSITSSDQKKLFQNFHIFEFRTGTSREGNPNFKKNKTLTNTSQLLRNVTLL